MTASSLIGQRLEEYHIVSQLGEGGMSTIYLGLDTHLQRYTAIKVIHAGLQNDPENVARFEREAQAVARLDHPNIVRLYRYGQVDDILYMAMQYIEGLDLRVVLQNYRRKNELIPPADALRIVKEICQALDYSHENGVLHRDVKPSNIMLNREGRAILTDFGLALLPGVDTQGKAFGTPQYMAPEQAQSPADVGPQSDLYAVGMLLYEMFTGEIPFQEIENPMEMVARRANTPPPPPSAVQPDLSPELEAVILKALALKPAERYQTGRQLTAALESSLPNFEVEPEPAEAELVVPPLIIEEPAAAEMSLPPVAEAVLAPETTVSAAGAAQAADPSPLSRPNRLGLPVPLAVLGGCAILALLAALLIGGGVQIIRSQFQKYYTWLPLTIGDEPPDNTAGDAYPEPPVVTRPSSTEAEEDGDDDEDDDDDDGESSAEQNPLLLQIVTNKEDSFYLVNVGSTAVPLAGLSFNGENNAFEGSEWGVASLAPGECVTIWKNRGNPKPPDVDCNEVGSRVEREPPEIFWKKSFDVIYQNTVITTCPQNGCEFFLEM